MIKAYLILIGDQLDREEIVGYLDGISKIISWQVNMPNSFFIKTELTSMEVFALIMQKFPLPDDKTFIFITQVSPDAFGLLPEGHWKWFGRGESLYGDEFKRRIEKRG